MATDMRTTGTSTKSASHAGYSATPLARKLGIQAESRVDRWGAPAEFPQWLAPLPLGFVDIKVCAVSDVWSGLKLVVCKELR
jgi:hypothetical protein